MSDPTARTDEPAAHLGRVRDVLPRLGIFTLLCYVPMVLLSLLPLIDSTRPPFVPLDSVWALVAYGFAESGGSSGAPFVALLIITTLVSRPGVTARRRGTEATLLAVLTLVGAAGGTVVNESGLKERLMVPRPHIVALAGEEGAGPLGRSAADFYALGDKQLRRDSLRVALSPPPDDLAIAPVVLEHWFDETGYSMPSGHALAALFFVVFFLGAALVIGDPRRIRMMLPLIGWGLLVGLSRPVLRVHTPLDLAVGGAIGAALALLALWLFRAGVAALDTPTEGGAPPGEAGV